MCSGLLLQLQSFKQTQDKPMETVTVRKSASDFFQFNVGFFWRWYMWYCHIFMISPKRMMLRKCWIDGKELPSKRSPLVGGCFSPLVHPDESHGKWFKIRRYNIQKVGRPKTWYILVYRCFFLGRMILIYLFYLIRASGVGNFINIYCVFNTAVYVYIFGSWPQLTIQ